MNDARAHAAAPVADPAVDPRDADRDPWAPRPWSPALAEQQERRLVEVVNRHNAGAGGNRPGHPGSPGADQPVGDFISEDKGIVYWTPEGQANAFGANPDGTRVAIGRKDQDGWVQIHDKYGGGRALPGALAAIAEQRTLGSAQDIQDRLGNDYLDKHLAQAIAEARSPAEVVAGSRDIGIFLDGTENWKTDRTNITQFYEKFQGTKFWHGGAGNRVDYPGTIENFEGRAFGEQCESITERALKDVQAQWKPGMRVHVFGFSRGGAEGIELAKRLDALQIPVEQLCLFEPVYSYGKPGQDSDHVKAEAASIAGNYVKTDLPTNVRRCSVLYAEDDERTWFPATQLNYDRNSTAFRQATIPGVHSDIGGHKDNNQHIAAIARHWMAAAYRERDPFGDAFDMTKEQYQKAIAPESFDKFRYGGYGSQSEQGTNYAWTANQVARTQLGISPWPNQQRHNHMARDLSWAGESLIEDPAMRQRFAAPKADLDAYWANKP